MKKLRFLAGIFFLTSLIVLSSCKKEDTEVTPVDNTPVLSFMTGIEYISSNATHEVNTSLKVGVLGSKNPSTNIDLATFKVNRIFNGITETVYENNNVGESYLSWESDEVTNSEVGDEKWTFTIKDYTGFVKEISFVITTVEEGSLSPVILFIEDENYISGDVTLDANSFFKAGISALANSNTNESLKSFEVIRIFEHTQTTIVYEESDINSSDFSWQDSLITSPVAGDEIWTYIVTDQAGRKNEISFTVTTTDLSMYTPVFSPTYLIVQQGGIELLDFYITCVTDDWEMIKIVVTYPGGLGSDVYVGNGQVITVGSPFTFSNYFPKMGGTWTFSILGTIKSGQHNGESFTAFATVTVTA